MDQAARFNADAANDARKFAATAKNNREEAVAKVLTALGGVPGGGQADLGDAYNNAIKNREAALAAQYDLFNNENEDPKKRQAAYEQIMKMEEENRKDTIKAVEAKIKATTDAATRAALQAVVDALSVEPETYKPVFISTKTRLKVGAIRPTANLSGVGTDYSAPSNISPEIEEQIDRN